jgi:hypothetical protein
MALPFFIENSKFLLSMWTSRIKQKVTIASVHLDSFLDFLKSRCWQAIISMGSISMTGLIFIDSLSHDSLLLIYVSGFSVVCYDHPGFQRRLEKPFPITTT